jgi:hypothetical protein
MGTFTILMDFSQLALFFDLSFQTLILHLLIFVCTHFPCRFFGSPKSTSLEIIINYFTYSSFKSILLKYPMKFIGIILTNYSVSKSPRSLLYCFLQFSFTFIPPKVLLKTYFFKSSQPFSNIFVQCLRFCSGRSHWSY